MKMLAFSPFDFEDCTLHTEATQILQDYSQLVAVHHIAILLVLPWLVVCTTSIVKMMDQILVLMH